MKFVDSKPKRRASYQAVNLLNKWLASSVVVFLLAVGIVTSCSTAHAGQSRISIKHAPIEVLRDPKGEALLTREGQFVSTNWSGYVLPKFTTAQEYTSAQVTWRVPEVVWEGFPAISSNWVGIGGFCKTSQCKGVDRSLIQLGTAQESLGSSATDYFAWYEMLPHFSKMTTLTVSPGDIITASLSCTGNCKGTQHWTLSMMNESTGKSWSQKFKYKSSKLSVEWIEEAPTDQHGVTPLADFGTSTFIQSMVNGASADLSSGDSIVLDDPHHQSSNVSAPNSTLDGFTACFANGDALPPCSFVAIP
jgi:hypothetical protein